MKIDLIQIPYALRDLERGVGRGPGQLIKTGLVEGLIERGCDVVVRRVQLEEPPASDLDAVTRLGSAAFAMVGDAVVGGRLPIVLGGNCASSLGPIAALDPARLGLVWFDAHGDFNTPETSQSGFIDGLALAIASGHCHADPWRGIGGQAAVRDSAIVLAGVRDLDDGEARLIAEREVAVVTADDFENPEVGFAASIDALRSGVARVYVHIDIDAIDPEEAPGVEFRTRRGLTGDQLTRAIEDIGERFEICGANLTDFNPDFDRDDRTARVVGRLAQTIVESARHS